MEGSDTSCLSLYPFGSMLKYVEDLLHFDFTHSHTHTHWTVSLPLYFPNIRLKVQHSSSLVFSSGESFKRKNCCFFLWRRRQQEGSCVVLWIHLGSILISHSYTAFLWHYCWRLCSTFLCNRLFLLGWFTAKSLPTLSTNSQSTLSGYRRHLHYI